MMLKKQHKIHYIQNETARYEKLMIVIRAGEAIVKSGDKNKYGDY